jgi:hypothetical protein
MDRAEAQAIHVVGTQGMRLRSSWGVREGQGVDAR